MHTSKQHTIFSVIKSSMHWNWLFFWLIISQLDMKCSKTWLVIVQVFLSVNSDQHYVIIWKWNADLALHFIFKLMSRLNVKIKCLSIIFTATALLSKMTEHCIYQWLNLFIITSSTAALACCLLKFYMSTALIYVLISRIIFSRERHWLHKSKLKRCIKFKSF